MQLVVDLVLDPTSQSTVSTEGHKPLSDRLAHTLTLKSQIAPGVARFLFCSFLGFNFIFSFSVPTDNRRASFFIDCMAHPQSFTYQGQRPYEGVPTSPVRPDLLRMGLEFTPPSHESNQFSVLSRGNNPHGEFGNNSGWSQASQGAPHMGSFIGPNNVPLVEARHEVRISYAQSHGFVENVAMGNNPTSFSHVEPSPYRVHPYVQQHRLFHRIVQTVQE